MELHVSGRVHQCCSTWTEGARGDVRESGLLAIWNGPGYRQARRAMASGALEGLCHDICPRLHDGRWSERRLELRPGSPRVEANQALLARELAARAEVLEARPLHLALCPSTYCNYDCIMCVHGRTPRRELPETIWDELRPLLPTLRTLTLLGGEPLANPLSMRFLRDLDERDLPDLRIDLTTNGSLLGETARRHLARTPLGDVTVSLNAGTAEVYERVQRGVALAEVLANVDALLAERRLGLTFSFVVQPANARTLVPFAELAASRGLRIRLLPLDPGSPDGLDYYDDPEKVADVLGSLDALAAWCADRGPAYGPEVAAARAAIAAEARRRGGLPPALPVVG